MVTEGGETMGDKVQTWRVVLATGDVREVVLTDGELGWRATCGEHETFPRPSIRDAMWSLIRGFANMDFDVREILAPGEVTRAELAAEVKHMRGREAHFASVLGVADGGQYRNDWTARLRRALDESAEVAHLRAENATLRASTDAAVDGVRAMLPAGLKVAREEGEAAAREWAANVCERMVVGGCAWSEEQAIAGRALLAAAENIRTLPIAAPAEAKL